MDPKILAVLGEWANRANQAMAPAVDWAADLGVEEPDWRVADRAYGRAQTIKGRSLAREDTEKTGPVWNWPLSLSETRGNAHRSYLEEHDRLKTLWERKQAIPERVRVYQERYEDVPWRRQPSQRKMPPPPKKPLPRTDRDDALVAASQKKPR